MTHACKSWSDALDLAAQKFDVLSWGRELDTGKSAGILRLSTSCLRDRHIRAIIYAIELGYEHITELSIHFCSEYSTDKGADRQDPFSPEGCHSTYLQWLSMSTSLPAPSSAKKSVYDRLSEGNNSTSKNNYPKDAIKGPDDKTLDMAVESKKRLQSMAALFRSLIKFFPLMQRLKLISFYGICSGFLSKSTVTNIFSTIARNSGTYKQLEGIIIRNCPLGDDMLKSAILNLSTALSIRLLVLHTCDLTDDTAGALGAILTAHKNARDNRLWELCLRKYGPTLKESIRSRTQEGHFTLAQLQRIRCMHELKGLAYLDLGYNNFGNELCTELLDSLKDDTYVHSISLDGNKNIRLSTSVMIPKYDNGDLDYIYDNLITLARNDEDRTTENSNCTQNIETSNKNLPIRMAERISQIENLDPRACTARSRAEQVVLQSICPDYEPSTKSNVITYLASYARSTDDLKTLMTLKAHPLVQLLLQNTTILHLLLDSSTTPTLLRFVHTRLSENRKLANKRLLEDADKALTHEKDIEEAVEELREHENLQGMIKKLKLAVDPINFCTTEKPVSPEYDNLTPRRRSRRGKSISQMMNTKHKIRNLDHLNDDITSEQATPPVDKDVYPLGSSSREKLSSNAQARPQSASKTQQTRTVRHTNKRPASNELQAGQRLKESRRENIYYANASSGFSNYSKGPLPFETTKKPHQRTLSAGKNIYKDKEDSDDIPISRKHKPDPFISKSAQRRSASQGKTGTANKNVASTIPGQETGQLLKKQVSAEKLTLTKQHTVAPRRARSRQQQAHRAPTSSKWQSPALARRDSYISISSDDEAKYTVIRSPHRPISTSKSTSLVRLSQGVPSSEPLRTSPHTKRKAYRQEIPTYTQVDASALSEIEPVRTSNSPINKPDNHGSGIEQSDFNDIIPTHNHEGSRDSFSRALHDNIDAIRLEHYAPPVLTEPSSIHITQEDKNKIYKRLLQDMASSQYASSDYDDTSAELRELSAKAQSIIQNSRLKRNNVSNTIDTPNIPKYNFYSHNKEDHDADELHVDELSNTTTSRLSQSRPKQLDSADIELKEIDQLLTKAQNMGEELDKSYKRINSLYMETMQDVYGSTTRKDREDSAIHLKQLEPKQVDMQVVDQLLVDSSPPQTTQSQTKSLAERLALSKMSTSGVSKWSAYSTTALTNDELLKSVDSIIGDHHTSHESVYQNGSSDASKITDLDISSMKESIKTNGTPILAANLGDESFESVIGLLYTVLMYFTRSDRTEALRVYKINEPRILAYIEEILAKLRSNELHLNEVSGCLYELVASLIKDGA